MADRRQRLDEKSRCVLYHEYGTQLRAEDDDTLLINVLCGRTLGYGIEFPLNEHERAAYKKDGDKYVQELAQEVRKAPEQFAKRGRIC